MIETVYRPYPNSSLVSSDRHGGKTSTRSPSASPPWAARLTAPLRTVSRTTTLAPYLDSISDGIEHADALSSAVANFGAKVRKAIDESARAGDADTSDLFTGISREIDKDLWFLEAHLYRKR